MIFAEQNRVWGLHYVSEIPIRLSLKSSPLFCPLYKRNASLRQDTTGRR